jgi:hypothetical protein
MAVKDSTALQELLTQWRTNRIGEIMSGEFGADNQGFREDWAILNVTGEEGRNGRWLMESDLRQLLEDNNKSPSSLEIVGFREPRDGEMVFMLGAASFWTVARVQSNRITLGYYKRSDPSAAIYGSEDLVNVDSCKHYQLWRIPDQPFGAKSGDSGSAVFAADKDGLAFVGLVVSLYMEDNPEIETEGLGDLTLGRDCLFRLAGAAV